MKILARLWYAFVHSLFFITFVSVAFVLVLGAYAKGINQGYYSGYAAGYTASTNLRNEKRQEYCL